MMRVLITGSCGALGSELVDRFCRRGDSVLGIDNLWRHHFIGPWASNRGVARLLQKAFANYQHEYANILDEKLVKIVAAFKPDLIIHGASQNSPLFASKHPHVDFEVNASGTLNLLEAFRRFCPAATMISLSSYRIYGEAPDLLGIVRRPMRYEFAGEYEGAGVDEQLGVDRAGHGVGGASKISRDSLCQDYALTHKLNIGIFRLGGITTGPEGYSPDDFLSRLVSSAIAEKVVPLHIYEGKEVRDVMHIEDLFEAICLFANSPRLGEIYNIGGGFHNSFSLLELVVHWKRAYGLNLKTKLFSTKIPGEPRCYYTKMQKFFQHYPQYKIRHTLEDMVNSCVAADSYQKVA